MGGRGELVGGPGATEKTDASVPAHEDERAARGRETFPYATFHEDIRKNVAILLLLAQYCVGLRPAAVIKCVFSCVVIRSIDVMYILQDFRLSGTRTV